ncbi:MAG: response regulator transcription factor [Spirosomataceae bacterium]
MVKISLIDDHEIFLKGLQKLLSETSGLTIVGTYGSGKALLNALTSLEVDLLMLDIQLPDIEPEKLIEKIRTSRPNVMVLYLTMMRGYRLLHRLEKHNIQGYVLKDAPVEALLEAIRAVSSGKKYFDDGITENDKTLVGNTATTPTNKLVAMLSSREYEVLQLVCQELSSAEIGEKLFLSTATVDTHRRNILVKLGVNNTVGLVKFAIQNGLLNEK